MPVGPGLLPPSLVHMLQFTPVRSPCAALSSLVAPGQGQLLLPVCIFSLFFSASHTHTDTLAHAHARTHSYIYGKLLLLMIIAGCTASVVSVPARGSPRFRLFVVVVALPFCCFFATLCILCSLFFRFIWPFIDIVNVIVAIAVVVFYSPAPFFISLYSLIFCCCFLFLFCFIFI